MLKEKIAELASQIHQDVIKDRRHLHQNPELSFHEYQTSAFVAAVRDQLGIPYQKMADTGIVALLSGTKPSDAVIALRADMDALPFLRDPRDVLSEGVKACREARLGVDARVKAARDLAACMPAMKAGSNWPT